MNGKIPRHRRLEPSRAIGIAVELAALIAFAQGFAEPAPALGLSRPEGIPAASAKGGLGFDVRPQESPAVSAEVSGDPSEDRDYASGPRARFSPRYAQCSETIDFGAAPSVSRLHAGSCPARGPPAA
jgi:hypothetical protein